jgi:hypothetical protein
MVLPTCCVLCSYDSAVLLLQERSYKKHVEKESREPSYGEFFLGLERELLCFCHLIMSGFLAYSLVVWKSRVESSSGFSFVKWRFVVLVELTFL